MKISVFGIGYIGAVTAACLADAGHEVIAVDKAEVKVRCLNEGRSPIVEKGLDELIAAGVRRGRLQATTDFAGAVRETEISLVCVGTPSLPDGSLNLSYVVDTCRQIGGVLKGAPEFHTVVLRSTVVPGTLENVVRPVLEEASGGRAGADFGLGNNPEFLREGTAVEDFRHPTQIVVGALDRRTAEKIMDLYDGLDGPRSIVDVNVAEGVKYTSNAWRASKITFANEVGNVLKRHGVDSHKVMRVLFEDRRINLGPSFLMPGYAFGGSCLPKDIRALRASAKERGLATPLLDALLVANDLQVDHAVGLVEKTGKKVFGLLGLSFKAGTDDLRESPLVVLAERLLRRGFGLRIFDPCVQAARRMDGANREYIERVIPHISRHLAEDPEELVRSCEAFIIGNGSMEFSPILDRVPDGAPIVDLARHYAPVEKRAGYAGICW